MLGESTERQQNGSYLILNVTVKKFREKSITVTNDFFKLLKGDTEYETDSVAGMYANEKKFFLSELNPKTASLVMWFST